MEDKNIKYSIRKSKRAKRLSLAIRADLSIVVTVPHRLPEIVGRAFFQKHQDWVSHKLSRLNKKAALAIPGPKVTAYARFKEQAYGLVKARVDHYAKLYGCSYKNIRIKNSQSKWGSCSNKNNLNFNYKILFLPPDLADYIVVHEVCHLIQMNHSPKFWQLVAREIPDYKQKRLALKNYLLA